jgi:hypothetical protein
MVGSPVAGAWTEKQRASGAGKEGGGKREMRVLDAGHRYALRHLDGEGEEILQFVKREGEGYPGNVGASEGTTMQEVLRALIDRAKYVNGQIPSQYTRRGIDLMREAIREFEMRAAERHGRSFAGLHAEGFIETLSTCEKCGHIGCKGNCHAKQEAASE